MQAPVWLSKCTALHSLRLCTVYPPGRALPPGALAGLESLELLEVVQVQMSIAMVARLHIIGREALRPLTAPGSTAPFPVGTA